MSSQALFLRATMLSELKRYEEAIADFDQAIKLKPDYVDVYGGGGKAYQMTGDKQKAIADYRKMLKLAQKPADKQTAQKELEKLGADQK
jgi:tetratricopeptide (TPR) repeat protein